MNASGILEETLDMNPTTGVPANRAVHRPAPGGYDRVVLTGFMGSGKTTVGSLLAEELGWQFLDLDAEIERRDGRSVPQIFAESGEEHFRRLESAALASLLGSKRIVLALGGGASEELGNRLLLEQTPRTAVVYLTAPFDVLVSRCQAQAAMPGAVERPVLADLDVAASRFEGRRRFYDRIASHRVATETLELTETCTAVLTALQGKKRS